MRLKTTLDQWHTLLEIDRAGSIHAAAARLNKSHTTLSYALKKLEQQMGVQLVRIRGRRAVLTSDGKSLLRRAVPMLEQAREIEAIGGLLSRGAESEITVTMDHLCCRDWLYRPLTEFAAQYSGTSVKIVETSLSATRRAVERADVDIAIINLPVTDHLAEAFGTVSMLPVVARCHPLAKKTEVSVADLTVETQIVVRDLSEAADLEKQDAGWLKSPRRITVDNFDHAWQAMSAGLGYCRIPDHMLAARGTSEVVQLPLHGMMGYQVPTHLVLPKMGRSGPATLGLYDLLLADAQRRMGRPIPA